MGDAAIDMSMSLLSDEPKCWVCGSPAVELHHVFHGWANRRISDKYGCTVYLCREHHTGKTGAHFDRNLDLLLKRNCQGRWEETYGDREEFRQAFGKSWL